MSYPLAAPASWAQAFELLKRYLTEFLAGGERRVVFIDELPWLAAPRSGFLSALDHFWNSKPRGSSCAACLSDAAFEKACTG